MVTRRSVPPPGRISRTKPASAPRPGPIAAPPRTPRGAAEPIVFFLRGVNVGGARTMRPSEFAKELSRHEVASIGAAGTFVARRPIDPAALRRDIEGTLPHRTEVLFLSAKELQTLLAPRGPAWDDPPTGTRRFLSVLAAPPARDPELPIFAPDETAWILQLVARIDRAVLSLRRIGDLRGAHYPNPAVEEAFGVPATTRGWETLQAAARHAGLRPSTSPD